MKYHYYLTHEEPPRVVRVAAKRRPSAATAPKSSGTWVMQEFFDIGSKAGCGWHSTWEVTWGRLSTLTYIGSAER